MTEEEKESERRLQELAEKLKGKRIHIPLFDQANEALKNWDGKLPTPETKEDDDN